MAGAIAGAEGTGGAAPLAGAAGGAAKPDGVEDRARRYGWVPKDEFKGDPQHWRDAQAYVSRTENDPAIAIQTLRRMDRQFAEVTRENKETRAQLSEALTAITETRATMDQLRDFAARSNEAGYDRARRELTGKRDAAIAAGDAPAAAAAATDLATLETERALAPKPPDKPAATAASARPATPTTPADPLPPDERASVDAWLRTNGRWYNADRKARSLAQGVLDELNGTRPDLTLDEKLVLVTEEVGQLYPQLVHGETKPRPAAAAVAMPTGGGVGLPSEDKRTFDNLPAEAKDAFVRFEKQLSKPGKPYTKDEYLASYRWE